MYTLNTRDCTHPNHYFQKCNWFFEIEVKLFEVFYSVAAFRFPPTMLNITMLHQVTWTMQATVVPSANSLRVLLFNSHKSTIFHHLSICIMDVCKSQFGNMEVAVFPTFFCLVVNGFQLTLLSTSMVILVSDVYYTDTVECIVALLAC